MLAAPIDPTLLALLSIFGGATLTVIAGFFGAWIQSRREHSKWLREQRYQSYLEYLKRKDRYDREARFVAAVHKDIERAVGDYPFTYADDADWVHALRDHALLREGPEQVERRLLDEQRALSELYAALRESITAFSLLGPAGVIAAAAALDDAAPDDRDTKIELLEQQMRKALAITV